MVQSALGLAFLISTSAATPAEQAKDVRCFIVAAETADSKDKEVETAGSIMLFYFLGRLDASSPGADLEALISREAERMTEAEKKEAFASCAAQVEKRGKDLSAMGE